MYELITRIIVTINEYACMYNNIYIYLYCIYQKKKYCAMLQKGADASSD